MTAPTDSSEASARKLAAALYVSGVITIVVGLFLGLVGPSVLFLIALVGLIDLAIARAYETGRIGPLAGRRRAEQSGDAATVAESDPSYNPYARED